MAANISQRRVRTNILGSPVRHFATWSLLLACARCDLARTVPMAELPPDLIIMQALLRMRCRTCQGRVEAAALDNGQPGWRGRVVKIWGPGSFD